MQCPRCQQDNPPSHKYCRECGTPLRHTDETGSPRASYKDQERALSEALEQQTATSATLRVITRAQTDVQPVFDVIAPTPLRLCARYASYVYRSTGELIH